MPLYGIHSWKLQKEIQQPGRVNRLARAHCVYGRTLPRKPHEEYARIMKRTLVIFTRKEGNQLSFISSNHSWLKDYAGNPAEFPRQRGAPGFSPETQS